MREPRTTIVRLGPGLDAPARPEGPAPSAVAALWLAALGLPFSPWILLLIVLLLNDVFHAGFRVAGGWGFAAFLVGPLLAVAALVMCLVVPRSLRGPSRHHVRLAAALGVLEVGLAAFFFAMVIAVERS